MIFICLLRPIQPASTQSKVKNASPKKKKKKKKKGQKRNEERKKKKRKKEKKKEKEERKTWLTNFHISENCVISKL